MVMIADKDTALPAGARTARSWLTPTDEQQPRPPYREGLAMAIGVFLWMGCYLGLVGVLVPARISQIAPQDKATVVAIMSTVAMIVSTIANIVEGALSDRTRSRFGRRTPWLIFGSVGSCIMILLWGKADTVWAIILCAAVFQIFLNAIVAPLIAVLSDRVAPSHRGMISSLYALGFSAGSYGGQIVAAAFLQVSYRGFMMMALFSLLAGPLAALLLREKSTRDMPVEKLTKQVFIQQFSFPTRDVRDYYLALFGKLSIMTAKYTVTGYQLYILTDYMRLTGASVARYIGMISMILLVTSVVMAIVSGPLTDKLRVRKIPVVIAGLLITVGVMLPSLAPDPRLMLAYALIAGIGMGIFNSVDQALNIEVLPNQRTAAKDLGILNMANNGGQVLGPVYAGIVIGLIGYHAIFWVAAVTALLGVILISLIRKVR
ncbi:MFS transporter [Sodalis ligni]|nr:MFS transporter [Sodalis ligni]